MNQTVVYQFFSSFLESLFYNEVVSDAHAELFNTKGWEKIRTSCGPSNCKKVQHPDSQKDHHANCICRPIKIRKNISMLITISVFVLVAFLLRELLWRMIKTILQINPL